MRPRGVTYSSWNACRTPSARSAYLTASDSSPSTAAIRASRSATCARYAVATRCGSVAAAHGSSGGAAGSSQSPSCMAGLSNSVPGPRAAVSPSTQARMLAYCRRNRLTSPNRW